tara:strand:+ start:152 stop:952 length:801 start_codon:yes stop_codon:yes gene_type:complete
MIKHFQNEKMENYMKFAICIPSMLDIEIISQSALSIRKNIIEANPEVSFVLFTNVDNFRQEDCEGDADDIISLYSSLESDNCQVDITYTGERKGYNGATKYLLTRFTNSDCEHCVFYDDDHEILNPIPIEKIYKILSDGNVYHLGNTYSKCSSENPFVVKKIKNDDKVIFVENNRNFYTYPGTIFSKSLALNVLAEADFFNTSDNAEDVIAKTSAFKEKNIISIFHERDKFDIAEHGDFRIPLDCHYSLDLRRYRRKTCSDVGNYN